MKRSLINEIMALKSRGEFESRHDFVIRLNDIEDAFNKSLKQNKFSDKELIRYIPIATVACLEAFLRSVYKELIDFGKPFCDNAIKFNQSRNVKFDFEIINAIQKKNVTVGEFVSHILPCNNFEDINANLSTLLGFDFFERIKKFDKEKIFEHYYCKPSKFIENGDQIITDIKRIFELRHIFCHEFATNMKINKEEILRCFFNVKIFLNQTNEFIWDLLYPNSPETQTDMNIKASEAFDELELELSAFISTIKNCSYFAINTSLFDTTIIKWKEYREAKANFDASPYEGGSIYPLIYANSLITITKEKLENLKNEYDTSTQKYNSP